MLGPQWRPRWITLLAEWSAELHPREQSDCSSGLDNLYQELRHGRVPGDSAAFTPGEPSRNTHLLLGMKVPIGSLTA